MILKLVYLIQGIFILCVLNKSSTVNAAKGALLWSDEFDSWQNFDNNWNAELGGHGWGNNELQYYTNLNHKLENGILTIEARRESFGGMRFTSSRLISKKGFKYGVFEMRARLPWGRGTWPAFWLLAAKRPLNWPLDGEIDIMEHVGYDPGRVHATIHCKNFNHMIGTQIGASTMVNNAFDNYHTYTLDWSANRIEAYIDGVLYYVYSKPDDTYESWPFDNDFNIILNLAVGGDWGGAMGLDQTIFPAQYHIEYVRQYEHVDGPAPTVVAVNRITIKAKANGRFVSADNNGNNPLIANKDNAQSFENFEMTKFSDGYVVLKSLGNQKYVSAENAGRNPLISNRNSYSDWEKFQLVTNSDGTVSFRAKNNWKFVCADNYGNDPLIANRDGTDDWEKFYITYL